MNYATTSVPVSVSGSASNMNPAYRSTLRALTTTTRASDRSADFLGKIVIQETAKNWFEGAIASRADHTSQHLHLLITKLEAYRGMPEEDRWPAATWPTDQAFNDAYTFIEYLPLSPIPAPEVSLADDGEINFLWKNESIYIDLGFYGTGTYSYFARGKDGQSILGENVSALRGLPDKLKALLSA